MCNAGPYSGKDNSLMWDEKPWAARNNMKIYGSTWMMEF